MPEKYVNILQYIPFIGMMAGKTPTPSRSLMELLIASLVPIFVGYIVLIPDLKNEVEHIKDARAHDITEYNQSINSMSKNIASVDRTVNELNVNVEVLRSSTEFIKEIANTKVKSIEGRLGVIEYELRNAKK